MLKVFSFVSLVSSVVAVSSPSPIIAVLFLIVTFTASAAVLIFSGCEFLGLTLIVVYVGAIAILFLFVVMMLDLKPNYFLTTNNFYSTTHMFYFFILFFVLVASVSSLYPFELFFPVYFYLDFFDLPYARDDIVSLSLVLFDFAIPQFFLAGLLLLSSLLGSIIATLRRRPGVRRQQVSTQLGRVPTLRFYSTPGSSITTTYGLTVSLPPARPVLLSTRGSSSDYYHPVARFLGFQPRATPIREGIVDLHNYIFMYLVFIFFFVFSLFFPLFRTFLFLNVTPPHRPSFLYESFRFSRALI